MKFSIFSGDPVKQAQEVWSNLQKMGIEYGVAGEPPWLISAGVMHITSKQKQELTDGVVAFSHFLGKVADAIKTNDEVGQHMRLTFGGSMTRQKLFDSAYLGSANTLPMQRPDAFYTNDGRLIFVEVEEMIGGLGMSTALSEAYGIENASLVAQYANLIRHTLEDHGKNADAANIHVVVLNPKYKENYNSEFQIFSRALSQFGITFSIAEPNQLEIVDETVYLQGRKVDLIHRFFRLSELRQYYKHTNALKTLLNIHYKKLVPIVQPWAELLCEKALFAFLQMPEHKLYWLDAIGKEHFSTLENILPKTWLADPKLATNEPFKSLLNSATTSKKTRNVWLKRSSDAWGGRSAIMGSHLTTTKWLQALNTAFEDYGKNEVWILQEHHCSGEIPVSFLSEGKNTLVSQNMKVRICPFMFANGKREITDILVTSRDDDKVHGARDSSMFPAIVK